MPKKKATEKKPDETVFNPPAEPAKPPSIGEGKKIRITKIKYSPGHVLIAYEIPRGDNEPDECSFSCSEEPLPALPEKLQALNAFVADMLELGCPDCRDEQISRLRVGSVSIDWKKAKGDKQPGKGPRLIMGAVISAWKKVQDGAQGANLNTPHRPEEPYVGGENAEPGAIDLCLSPKCATILSELIALAEGYLNGERLQPAIPGLDGQSKAAGEREE